MLCHLDAAVVTPHTQLHRVSLHRLQPLKCITARSQQCGLARRPALRTIVCRATPSPPSPKSKLNRSIWTAIDVAALLGSVGGALAALLGVVSPTYALTLPLVLPVVSLIAALQREDLTNEEGRQYLSELSSSLGRDSAALLREAAAAIEEVRREARGQSAAASRLSALEDKLAVLEGAVLGAARNSREAAAGVSALGSALSQSLAQAPPGGPVQQGPLTQQSAQLLAGLVVGEVMPLLRAELAGGLGPWLAESNAAAKRLDTRLAVVEGSLSGLEVAQAEGLAHLARSINSSMGDAQSTLQSSVRVEVATAVEPLKQLPQLVAAAAAKAAAAAVAAQQQQQQGLEEQLAAAGTDNGAAVGLGAAGAGGVAGLLDQSVLLQELREVVASEVAAAAAQIMNQQGVLLSALSAPVRPSPLADEQWEALGRRLARLERLVRSVPELGEQALAGQLAPLMAAHQAATAVQETAAATVRTAAEQLGASYDRVGVLIREFEGVKARLEDVTDQLLSGSSSSNSSAAAGVESSFVSVGGAEQLVQQLQESVQQLLEQQQQQPAAGEDTRSLLLSLQQQVQGLRSALQQVQMDIPFQIQLAMSQSSEAAAARGDAFDGNAFDDSSGSSAAAAAATAASAASAAAQGIAEVRQLLGGVQMACGDLQVQVGTLAAQVAAQQATILTSQEAATTASAAAAQEQLADTSAQLSRDLSEQLSGLCSSLEQQLQGLQQQLVAAAAAAASQAATDAAAAAAAAAAAVQPSRSSTPGYAAQQDEQQQQGEDQYGAGTSGQQDSFAPSSRNGSSGSAAPQQQQFANTAASPGPAPEQPYTYDQVAAGGWAGYEQDQQQQQQPGIMDGSAGQADLWPGYSSPAAPAGMWTDAAVAQQQQPDAPAGWSPLGAAAPADSAATNQPLQQQQHPLSGPAAGPMQPPQAQPGQLQAGPDRLQAGPDTLQAGPDRFQAVPDISGLTEEQLRTEGLRLLRTGREATRGTGSYAACGPDFAAAETQLQAAVACFSAAVESEPQDTRALGNLGNALLAQGELKKGLLEELRLSAAQGGLGLEAAAAGLPKSFENAEARLRSEASGLLTRAGEIFRRVLEVDGWSSRALVNWGKAMVGRAELAVDRSAATKLYNAAIDKFEAVLEEDPGMVVAKYRCALAMQGLAVLNPDGLGGPPGGGGPQGGSGSSGLRQRLVLLSDAVGYLSDVVAVGAGGDDGLREAAAAALRQVQEQLEMAKLEGK